MKTKSVWARLWNDQREYNVQLLLEVRELWGQNSVPDDYAVSRLSLVGGVGVEDGTYSLEYTFNGRTETAQVRVVDSMLMSPVEA